MINPKAYDFVDAMIQTMDSKALNQLLGGYGSDVDTLMSDLLIESHHLFNESSKIGTNPAEEWGLEALSMSFEETMRREDMNYFITSIIPPEMFELNWHHLEWGRILTTYQRIFLLASRDSGKTYFFTLMFSLWRMYRHDQSISKYNHPHIYHFTHTVTFGELLLVDIKNFIERIPILRERLYNPSTRNWKKAELWTLNGCHWQTEGFWSASRGPHPQTVIVDDPFKEDVAFSPTKRARGNKIFFDTVIPMLTNDGKLAVVGTPFMEDDLYGTVRNDPDKRSMFAYFEYPAIFPDGTLLWEGRHTFKSLMGKKRMQGSLSFTREYLVRSVSSASSIFPYDTISSAIRNMEDYTLVPNKEGYPKSFTWIVMGCDNAKSANVGADYSFYTVWGITEEGEMWLMNAWINKGASFREQIAKIKSLNHAFQPDLVVVEDNNFQAIYTEELKMNSSVPVVGHTTGNNKKSMYDGLPSMSVMFENGKIHLPYGDEASRDVADRILAEFNSVTYTAKGKLESVMGHDDGAMSTWFGSIGKNHVLTGGGGFKFGFLDI